MKKQLKDLIFLLSALVMLASISGCTGTSIGGNSARAGETVSVAVGYQEDLTLNNISIEIYDMGMNELATYNANDPRINMIYNLYPDPISALLVSGETNLDIDGSLSSNQEDIEGIITNASKDLFQTVVIFDLPQTIPAGLALIQVKKSGNSLIPNIPSTSAPWLTMTILPGVGTTQNWVTQELSVLNDSMKKSVQRVSNYGVVTFAGDTVPHSIQLTLTHNNDMDYDETNGVGRAFITTPRADIISVSSHDTGKLMNVILTPVKTNKTLSRMEHFKFFVAGNIENWKLSSGGAKAFDNNGDLITDTVTAHLCVHTSTGYTLSDDCPLN